MRKELWDRQGKSFHVQKRSILRRDQPFSPFFYRKWIWAMLIHKFLFE